MFPWTWFTPELIKEAKRKVSDIEFLSIKEFEGKLKTDKGTLSATGDLASITAASGKDLYLAKAKVSLRAEGSANISGAIIVLKANDVIKATWAGEIVTATVGANSMGNYEFVLSGVKVITTQVIKLEVTSIDADVEVSGELVCFDENTDDSPQIPSI